MNANAIKALVGGLLIVIGTSILGANAQGIDVAVPGWLSLLAFIGANAGGFLVGTYAPPTKGTSNTYRRSPMVAMALLGLTAMLVAIPACQSERNLITDDGNSQEGEITKRSITDGGNYTNVARSNELRWSNPVLDEQGNPVMIEDENGQRVPVKDVYAMSLLDRDPTTFRFSDLDMMTSTPVGGVLFDPSAQKILVFSPSDVEATEITLSEDGSGFNVGTLKISKSSVIASYDEQVKTTAEALAELARTNRDVFIERYRATEAIAKSRDEVVSTFAKDVLDTVSTLINPANFPELFGD